MAFILWCIGAGLVLSMESVAVGLVLIVAAESVVFRREITGAIDGE